MIALAITVSPKTSGHFEKRLIGGEDGRSVFISCGNKLKETKCSSFINRQITDFVNNQNGIFEIVFNHLFYTVFFRRLFEFFHKNGKINEIGGNAFACSFNTDSLARCVFPTPLEPTKMMLDFYSINRRLKKSIICSLLIVGW